MIIDSHCHLDFDSLNNKLDNVVKNANNVGVKYLLTICTNNESFKIIRNILDKYKNIYGTYGIHPHETKKYSNLTVDDIKINLIKNKKIIGIGESGLDFYYNHSEPDIQKKCFLNHIKASQETSKTLIVHSRNAEKETFEILNKYKNLNPKILMHCFTGSSEFAYKLLTLNSYFSASGIITFKNSIDLQKTFKLIPNDKLLIETDSPYLSPVPFRGKKNEPSFIKYTLEKLAQIKDTNTEKIEKVTNYNFKSLFNLN